MFGYKHLQKEFCMNLLCWTGDHRWAGQTLTGTWHKFPPSLETLLMFVHYNPWYATCPEQWAPMRFNIEQMSSCPNEGKRCPPPANTHKRHEGQLNPNNEAKLSSAIRVQVFPNYWRLYPYLQLHHSQGEAGLRLIKRLVRRANKHRNPETKW